MDDTQPKTYTINLTITDIPEEDIVGSIRLQIGRTEYRVTIPKQIEERFAQYPTVDMDGNTYQEYIEGLRGRNDTIMAQGYRVANQGNGSKPQIRLLRGTDEDLE